MTSAMRRNQRWASTSTSSYQSSSAPLPPAFRPNGGKRSRGDSSGSRKGRPSGEGAEEGDLMLGFVELRRIIASVKGQ
jgi:brefeldin A-resistance guanine nucleotide exchange factor 1